MVKEFIKRLWFGGKKKISHRKIIEDLEFPRLISFPRTGSHWLRMVLELYSDKPLLRRSFFEHKSNEYLLYHTHDLNLSEKGNRVIYLFRNPVNVIFSQLMYYGQDINNDNLVSFWTNQYAAHLIHWTCSGSESVLLVKYENILNYPVEPFENICQFLKVDFNRVKLENILNRVTRDMVSSKTSHDKNVVSRRGDYEDLRKEFLDKRSQEIEGIMAAYFENMGKPDLFQRLFNG